MGFDYEIVYKKRVENRVADALSRVTFAELLAIAVSSISSELLLEIWERWETNMKIKEIKDKLLQNADFKSRFEWKDGQLLRKGRLVVGNEPVLQKKLIQLFHEGGLGGHS